MYEITRTGKRIIPVENKKSILAKVSSNLLAILPNTRCVLVEDEDDRDFYSAIIKILLSTYKKAFPVVPVIQPVSIGKGNRKKSGGKTVVREWTRKLSESGLSDLVYGLVDRDDRVLDDRNIFTLKRYSIENYLLDPIVVAASRIETEGELGINGELFNRGNVYKLLEKDSEFLQNLSNSILNPLSKKLSEKVDDDLFEVSFVSGHQLVYPVWLRDFRGHDLKREFYQVYGKPCDVKELIKAFERLQMIPEELETLFNDLSA